MDGRLTLIDEIHARLRPLLDARVLYEQAARPRIWTRNSCGPGTLGGAIVAMATPPALPADIIAQLAARYIDAYERLTGQTFVPGAQPAEDRIQTEIWRHILENGD